MIVRLTRKAISGFCLILLASAVFFGLFHARRKASHRLQVGQSMPAFRLPDTTGALLTEHSFSGQKYGLLFFRTDCGHCQQELMDVDQLLPQFEGRLSLLAVSLNSAEETIRARLRWRFLMPVYLAPIDLARSLQVRSVPLLILVGDDGRISYIQTGERGRPYQRLVLERFLQGASLAEADLRKIAQERPTSEGCVLQESP